MDVDAIAKKRIHAVILTSNNLRIEGAVYVGQGIRLSDELNVGQRRFVVVANAKVTESATQSATEADVVLVNKDHVACAFPVEADEGQPE